MQLNVVHEVGNIFLNLAGIKRWRVKQELACKPGSVVNSHSSATAITDCL